MKLRHLAWLLPATALATLATASQLSPRATTTTPEASLAVNQGNVQSVNQTTPEVKIKVTKCTSVNGLPDTKCNQPILNQKLTVQQICDPNFRTGTIRPPTSYTNPLKKQKMIEYGITDDPSLLELDHLQAITDLGDPQNPTNLWPQYWHLNLNGFDAGAKTKDSLEVKIHPLLCGGKMTPQQVNDCFADWITCYRKVVGELPKYNAN